MIDYFSTLIQYSEIIISSSADNKSDLKISYIKLDTEPIVDIGDTINIYDDETIYNFLNKKTILLANALSVVSIDIPNPPNEIFNLPLNFIIA